jgi:hypothetical protein
MAFMGGYVVRDLTIPPGKEPFNSMESFGVSGFQYAY